MDDSSCDDDEPTFVGSVTEFTSAHFTTDSDEETKHAEAVIVDMESWDASLLVGLSRIDPKRVQVGSGTRAIVMLHENFVTAIAEEQEDREAVPEVTDLVSTFFGRGEWK